MELVKFFQYVLIITLLSKIKSQIDISDYDYPTVDDENYIYIPILSVNDIHGSFFPTEINVPDTDKYYESGGLEYIASYIEVLKNQFNGDFLWFDAGDEFQGTLESYMSKGSIITESFNALNLSGATFGNHEWDNGEEYLNNRLKESKFPYIVANIFNSTSGSETPFDNQVKTKIFEVKGIKIGVLGLGKIVNPETLSEMPKEIEFLSYKKALMKHITELRENADAVILLGHVPQKCKDETDVLLNLKIRTKDTKQAECNPDSDLAKFLNRLPSGFIDGFIAGDSHEQTHHWINDIPVMSNINSGKYASIMYLPFDKKTKKLVKEQIKIESPLPICEKIFSKTKRCDPIDPSKEAESEVPSNFKFHNVLITKDTEKLKDIREKYYEEFNKYKTTVITKIDNQVDRVIDRENELGNLYADILRKKTGADIAIISKGILRKGFFKGNITVKDLFETTPYDNKVVKFKMTGGELLKMLREVEDGKYKYYSVSGLKLAFKKDGNQSRFVSAKLFDGIKESDIDTIFGNSYTVASLDFLILKGGDDFNKIIKWYNVTDERNNYQEFDYLRNVAAEYLKNVDEIRVKRIIDENNPRIRFID